MDVLNTIIQLLGLLGLGAVVGIILQYRISKKLKIFETKLIIFRRVYRQLYHACLLCGASSGDISRPFGNPVSVLVLKTQCKLDLNGDLGDILFYADGELRDAITKFINFLYFDTREMHILSQEEIRNMLDILDELKKVTEKESSMKDKIKEIFFPVKPQRRFEIMANKVKSRSLKKDRDTAGK